MLSSREGLPAPPHMKTPPGELLAGTRCPTKLQGGSCSSLPSVPQPSCRPGVIWVLGTKHSQQKRKHLTSKCVPPTPLSVRDQGAEPGLTLPKHSTESITLPSAPWGAGECPQDRRSRMRLRPLLRAECCSTAGSSNHGSKQSHCTGHIPTPA